ncbi:MAG: SMI1/KNR4 family protein [Helicobacteraceae bacterium]|nr:SMI1/KNR4 family protein [Helicobacteraceae bacterium]
MVEFIKTEAKITENKIVELETKLGYSFPEEYRTHLLKYNGGKCKPNVFSFIENNKETKSSIDWFLAIYEGKYDNLKLYMDMYIFEEKRLPDYFIPIAHDSGGNLVCISCSENENGFVYFWDHENEGNNNVYLISESFNTFIKNLTEN